MWADSRPPASEYTFGMTADTTHDTLAFRDALGQFATGVTVVTAGDCSHTRVGVTANSFSSVSLNPPLVLWSLDRRSHSLAVFESSKYFIVNVLADDQIDLSNHFAQRGVADKFSGIPTKDGVAGTPLLTDCAACFQCEKRFTYEGGDHLIFVGEVISFSTSNKPTLLYHKGHYAIPEKHPALGDEPAAPASFVQDYLDYLLTQCSAAFERQFQAELDQVGMSREQWRIISCASEFSGLHHDELARLTLLDGARFEATIHEMIAKRWLRQEAVDIGRPKLVVTDEGMRELVPLVSCAKAHEASVMVEYTAAEQVRLKNMLRSMLHKMDEPLRQIVERDSR